MPQTLLPWLEQIFPEADAPYTMGRIIARLQQYHTPSISRSSTYRAHKSLLRSTLTAPLVRGIRNGNRIEYPAAAARRIAQRVTRDKPPTVKKSSARN